MKKIIYSIICVLIIGIVALLFTLDLNKGNTYILSNNDRLIEAKSRLIKRDTNVL